MLFESDYGASKYSREKALVVFVLLEDTADSVDDSADLGDDQDVNQEAYKVEIRSFRCFDLLFGYVAFSVSFRMEYTLTTLMQDVSKVVYFKGCSEGKCETFSRVACAVNLKNLFGLLSQCWGFSLVLDVSIKVRTSHLDIRLRFSIDGGRHNLGMLALLMFERKSARIIFNTSSYAGRVVR